MSKPKPKKIRKKDFEKLLREYDEALSGYHRVILVTQFNDDEDGYNRLMPSADKKRRAVRKRLIALFMDAKGRGK